MYDPFGQFSPYKRIIYLSVKNFQQYDKKMKIIKVKRGTSSFVHFFLRKFLLKLTLKTYVIYTIVITVLVLSEDTSAPTVRGNFKSSCEKDNGANSIPFPSQKNHLG